MNNPDATISNSQQLVTMCTSITISLSSYNYDGTRPLSFAWSLVAPTSDTALATYLLAQTNQSSVTIQASQLVKLTQFQIDVLVRNFLSSSVLKSISFNPTGCLSISATFNADLTSLVLTFSNDDYTLTNGSLNANTKANNDLCVFLFQSGTLGLMGTSPQCQ